MQTLRVSLIVAVALTLVGGGSGSVQAQAEPESDAYPPTDAPTLEWVTGTSRCGVEKSAQTSRGDDWGRLRGWTLRCEHEMSDQRLRGVTRAHFSQDCTDHDGCLSWARMITGDDDAWTGWWIGTEGPAGQQVSLVVLTGSGANEGYSAVLTNVGEHGATSETTGFIYEGEPPPVP